MGVFKDRSATNTVVSSPSACRLIANISHSYQSQNNKHLNNNNNSLTSSIPYSTLVTGVEASSGGSRLQTRCFHLHWETNHLVSRELVDDRSLPYIDRLNLELELTMRETTTTTTKSIVLYQVPVTINTPSLTAVVDRLYRLGIILSDLDVCVCVCG